MKNLKTRKELSESSVQKQITGTLEKMGAFFWRNNTGCILSFYKGKRRFIKYGKVGSPDIIAVINGRFVGIEVKGPKGVQSPEQKEFQKQLERAGGKYILASSWEDFLAQF